MKSFFFSYISVTVYRIQENCEQNMFSALKNPKENKEKEKEWNKILTVTGGKSSWDIDNIRVFLKILYIQIVELPDGLLKRTFRGRTKNTQYKKTSLKLQDFLPEGVFGL